MLWSGAARVLRMRRGCGAWRLSARVGEAWQRRAGCRESTSVHVEFAKGWAPAVSSCAQLLVVHERTKLLGVLQACRLLWQGVCPMARKRQGPVAAGELPWLPLQRPDGGTTPPWAVAVAFMRS